MKNRAHPFIERIRAERRIISVVNSCEVTVPAQLAGTSVKSIARWFEGIPVNIRQREDVQVLREKLEEAGQATKLASNGSHRGAMVAERVRRDALNSAISNVERAVQELSTADNLT